MKISEVRSKSETRTINEKDKVQNKKASNQIKRKTILLFYYFIQYAILF